MSVTIPDTILAAARMSEEELRLEIAALLYAREKLTLGQSSRLAGVGQRRFLHFLSSRSIAVHYDPADLDADLETLDSLLGSP